MIRQSALAFISLVINLASFAGAIAQLCPALPVDDASPWKYQPRANPPRCEGMYESPVAGHPEMTLVSLTFGDVDYDLTRDRELNIHLQAAPEDKTIIQAVGIPERLYYRLDVEWQGAWKVFQLPCRCY
jgi:hypothetical protein